MLKQLSDHVLQKCILSAEKLTVEMEPLKMAPKSAESVGVLVKQRELVYGRWCIKWWFNEGKINNNIKNGMCSTKGRVLNLHGNGMLKRMFGPQIGK